MLTNDKKQILEQIISSFSKEEIAWASGYLSGFVQEKSVSISSANAINDLTILFVSETGNAKFLANEIAKKLKEKTAKTKLKAAEQYRFSDLKKEKNLLLITSTHGEGEIPDSGKKLFHHLTQEEKSLPGLTYFVVALGDKNYPLFCEAGKKFDETFEKLGAKKSATRIEFDLDFENFIPQITNQVEAAFGGENIGSNAVPISATKTAQTNFSGEIIANINLNDAGSSKETHHIEIAVDDEIYYEPGDSVGILFGDEELGITGKITPRLYSIASSRNEHGNEVHLTVSLLRYFDKDGKEAEGLFSGRLARLKIGEKINFYVSKNRNFKLPSDDKNIIMVGPGTGIAPFRSFIAERNYRNAPGKNWLFFGERNFQSDFLYQTEWQAHVESGLLTKIDVAFSRDQKEKIYVQDRIRENAAEVLKWLDDGAYFYICGDKANMARDVENTLLAILGTEKKFSAEEAKKYLENLHEEGRYLKDVY